MRAHLNKVITDNQGNVVAGCTVRVLQAGTTTLITDTLWVDGTTTTQMAPNPFTSANGVVNLYCDASIRVRLGITPPEGVEVFFEDLDFEGSDAFIILRDASGAAWKVTVDTTGHLTTTAV